MKQNISHDFHPVKLRITARPVSIIVRSVEEAAEELLTHWPDDDGDRFYEAVKACLDCLQGKMGTEAARRAFVRAAVEAGIPVELEVVRPADAIETELNLRSTIQ